MREILFRGKPSVREYANISEWVEGHYLIYNGFPAIKVPAIKTAGGAIYNVIPETVGQYTGLKDKNGVMIFEGDIINCMDSDGCMYDVSVKYANGGFYSGCLLGSYLQEDLCVIGNIHDNPELLKKETV